MIVKKLYVLHFRISMYEVTEKCKKIRPFLNSYGNESGSSCSEKISGIINKKKKNLTPLLLTRQKKTLRGIYVKGHRVSNSTVLTF